MSGRKYAVLWSVVSIFAVALSENARSQDPSPPVTEAQASLPASAESLDLQSAVAAAWSSSPELRAAEADIAAGAARIESAALRPPLELTGAVENALGSGELSGLSGSEITLGVAQVFELGRKRAERIGVAQLEHRSLEYERDWLKLALQADVTDVFIEGVALERRVTVIERARQLAQSIVSAAERRVNAGRSSQAELSRARVTIAQADIELLALASERQRLHRELARLIGRESAAALFRLTGTLDVLPELPSGALLESLLASAPDAQRATVNRELARARLQLAEAQRRPDFSAGAGVRNLAATDDVALVFSGSIALGASRRARSGIAEARAEVDRADALAGATGRQVAVQARNLADALALAARQLELLRTVVVPESQRAEELFATGYGLGRFSFLEVADAQRQSIEASRSLIELTLRYHQTILDLGRLLGRPQLSEGRTP